MDLSVLGLHGRIAVHLWIPTHGGVWMHLDARSCQDSFPGPGRTDGVRRTAHEEHATLGRIPAHGTVTQRSSGADGRPSRFTATTDRQFCRVVASPSNDVNVVRWLAGSAPGRVVVIW